MSRAVGGASAAGCGIFGVGSLLIGVGLTVWLGSMALSGSTGGDRSTTTAATTAPVTVPALPAAAAITLDPAEALGDGGPTVVTGVGFAAGPVVVALCLTHAPGTLEARCDSAVDAPIDAEPDGEWLLPFVTPRLITVDGTAYDCASAPGVCSVVAHLPGGTDGVSVPISFAGGLPPVDALAPPTG
jgi:hypothetical protein